MPYRILVVDDELSTVELIRNMIYKEEGFEVDIVLSSTAAITAAKGNYDLIISDLNMPDLNGMDMIKIIRKTKPFQRFVIATGHACFDTPVPGAVYLYKPFGSQELLQAVYKSIYAP